MSNIVPILSRLLIYGTLPGLIIWQGVSAIQHYQPYNGFDLNTISIPLNQVFNGGPAKDGIPAIDAPVFDTADNARKLEPDDQVLGIVTPQGAKAYPVQILDRHEIVNDRWGDEGLLISYCPLCGTGMAFRVSSQDSRGFGVSGLLYNSDVLLYDRTTESLWSQLMGKAVSGPRMGERLQATPLQHTTWADWQQRHPDSLVLSRRTGHFIDYDTPPYSGYAQSDSLYFPVQNRDRRRHPKARVIGLELNGETRVWPFSELARRSSVIVEQFGGQEIRIHYDAAHGSAHITGSHGSLLPAVSGYWFAWMAFHPDSSVYSAPQGRD